MDLQDRRIIRRCGTEFISTDSFNWGLLKDCFSPNL